MKLSRYPGRMAAAALAAALLLVIPNAAPGWDVPRNAVVLLLSLAGLVVALVAMARLGPLRPERFAQRWHRRLALVVLSLAWLALAGYGWLCLLYYASPLGFFQQRDLAMVVRSSDGGAAANLYYHRACFLGCSYRSAELASPIGPFERTLWRGERPTRVDARSWFHTYTIVVHDGMVRAEIDGRPAEIATFQAFEEHIF